MTRRMTWAALTLFMTIGAAAWAAPAGPANESALIRYEALEPAWGNDWEQYWLSPAWSRAETIGVDWFRPRSSPDRPRTQARALWSDAGIRILWRVEAPVVSATRMQFMDPVSLDSCVEFFFEPGPEAGYMNIEVNAAGTLLARRSRPDGEGYDRQPVPREVAEKIQIRTSLRGPVEPPMIAPEGRPIVWYAETLIPMEVLHWAFGIEELDGAEWRANFYKTLGEPREHAHWAAWAPLAEGDTFHAPDRFAPIRFEPRPERETRRLTVRHAPEPPPMTPPGGDWAALWDAPEWTRAATAEVTHFYPRFNTTGNDHRPPTHVRALYDEDNIYLLYRVFDRYVLSTRTEYQDHVWNDAAVEFFVAPRGHEYVNFEINCGGAALIRHHVPEASGDGFTTREVPWESGRRVRIETSMPPVVSPEIEDPVTWHAAVTIPSGVLEGEMGPLGPLPGATWRANFFKISRDNSHPHGGSWSYIPGEFTNFHTPWNFGEIYFEPPPPTPERAAVRRAEGSIIPGGDWQAWWDGPVWSRADTLEVTHFNPANQHRPPTRVRLLYDDEALHLLWRVEDRWVRAVRTEYNSDVWRDSAVEFFVEPVPGRGYINFEITCGATALMHMHDPFRRPADGEELPEGYGLFPLPWELGRMVRIHGSLPRTVEPEITEPVTWFLYYAIPFDFFETQFGGLRPVSGATWRANFYKIAQENSRPHGGTWSPILRRRAPAFHQPEFFGELVFD